jgi:signal transduction histidine kinase
MTGGGELMIRTEKRETRAIIQISDTGVGISSDRLGNIFDAYESSHRNGRGFGLTTVKKLVEKQKGSISIYSELGKGTCFTIELPLHNEEAA